MGVRVNTQAETPRVVLLSVPYALKASDAETLGGLPASAFLRAAPPGIASSGSDASSSSSASASLPIGTNPTGSGTKGDITIWTGSATLGNSHMAEGASGLSVNEALNLPSTGAATSLTPKSSQTLNITGASFNKGSATSILQHWQARVDGTGNNTNSNSSILNILYAPGTAVPASKVTISTNGTLTAGHLAGEGSAVTSVNAAKLGGFLPSAFARLGASDNFTGSVTAASFSTGGSVSGATGGFTGNVSIGGNLTVSGTTKGTFSGNGAAVTNVNAAALGGLAPGAYAQIAASNLFTGANSFSANPTIALAASGAIGPDLLLENTASPGGFSAAPAGTASSLDFSTEGTNSNCGQATSRIQAVDDGKFGNNLVFSVEGTSGCGVGEVMRIAPNANFGIGTTSPDQKLTVAGVIESTAGGFKQPAGNTIAQEYWAVVNSDGSLARGSGATASSNLLTGQYEVDFSTDVTACAYVATPTFGPAYIYVEPRTSVADGVFVATFDATASFANFGFHLVVHC